MAITAAEREDILELLIVMFNATPGPYLDDITAAYEATGHNLAQLANLLASTGAFQSLHPNFQTASEFADDLLGTFGLEGDAEARAWVISNFNAGMTKAQIMFAAWNYLEDLPDTAAPQYVTARDILKNKAEVSEYYSVTVEGEASDIEALQDIVADVDETTASVTNAIDEIDDEVAQGPQLTGGQDNIEIFGNDPVNITGIVDGNGDGNTAGSTYSAGDRVEGNGNTNLNLTVIEGGPSDFVILDNIEAVNVYAATGAWITFNAAGWSNVGELALNDGIDGGQVWAMNLDLGTDLVIENVQGEIGGTYMADGGGMYVYMSKDSDADTENRIATTEEGDVTFTLTADSYASIGDNGNDLEIGDVTVNGDSENTFSMWFNGDTTVGNVDVNFGDESNVWASVDDSIDLVMGNVTIDVGADSSVDLDLTGDGGGSIEVASLAVMAGDDSWAGLFVSDFDTGVFGDASLQAGANGMVDVQFSWFEDSLEVGNVTAVVGDWDENGEDNEVEVGFFETGPVTEIASIHAEGGANADVQVWISRSGDGAGTEELMVGDITVNAGGDYAWLTVQDHNDITLGNVTMMAGTSADMYVEGEGQLANIAVGNIDVSVSGAGGFASVSLDNSLGGEDEDNAGSVTAGNVSMTVADDSEAYFFVWNYGYDATTEDNEGMAANGITVGDVSLTGGSNSDVDTSVTVSMSMYQWASEGSVGDVTVGDVNITVGDGFVSATIENEVYGYAYIYNYGEDGAGNMSVGDVTMTGGDFASLSFSFENSGDAGDVGNQSVSSITVNAGESAEVYGYVYNYGDNGANVGDTTVGNVDVSVEQDSYVSISISNWMDDGVTRGDLTVGDVNFVLGDNSTAELQIYQWAEFDQSAVTEDTDLVDGDFMVGDVSVAMSATATEDNVGDANVDVDISKSAYDLTGFESGMMTVGDVNLSAPGVSASLDAYIWYGAEADMMGDVSVGVVSFTAGADAAVTGNIWVSNELDGGGIGNVSVEGISVDVGGDSTANVYFGVAHWNTTTVAGDSGVQQLGMVDVAAGDGAYVGVWIMNDWNTGDANVEGIDVGDVTATVGEAATVTVSITADGGDLGALDIGNIDADVAADGDFYLFANVTFDSIGNVTVGDIDLTVTDGGYASVTISTWGTTTAGDILVGDLHLGVDDDGATTGPEETPVAVGGSIYVSIEHSGAAADNIVVGDLNAMVGGTADDDWVRVEITSYDGADVTIGDIVVGGEGTFFLDNAVHDGDNESYLYINTSGTITIGNVDFSAYEDDITLNLAWTDAGAANISAGSGNDAIFGNAGANVISGGDGQDDIDISQGGDDRIVTDMGDSGVTQTTVDIITGFDGDDSGGTAADGDKLDFNMVAGAANNYVEGDTVGTFAGFIAEANSAINSTVMYYADYVTDDGMTYVAVTNGSGDVGMVIALVGNQLADLTFGNIVA
jgi:hypothetical protein